MAQGSGRRRSMRLAAWEARPGLGQEKIERMALVEGLSGLDSSFLYLESPRAPMHVGGVSVIEGSLRFDDFRDLLASRIHLTPRLTQRLVEIPFGLDHPYWIDDPHFTLDHHLHHTALPHPGDWRQLRRLACRLFAQPLDRSRPLWEFIFVEGVDAIGQVPGGSVALISKIHHAAIDGVSGADTVSLLFDITPQPRPAEIPPESKSETLPGDFELVTRSALNFASRPFKLPRMIMDVAKATLQTGRLTRVAGADLPAMPFRAPRTPFNGVVSADRAWNTALLDFERVKALRAASAGSTVNDVVLTICAGGLRRYLLEHDALPSKPLVAMVPVSTRTVAEKNTMGNQVSGMFVELGTHIEDSIRRLIHIQNSTRKGKLYQGALDAKSLMKHAELIPFGIAGQAARLYTRAQLSRRHSPVFNVVITNVPGPPLPLYVAGHKLLAHMGMAPIFDGVGLVVAVFSYDGMLSISLTSSRSLVPDIDRLAWHLRTAANEFEAALEVKTGREPDKESVAGRENRARCQAILASGRRCRNRARGTGTHCGLHAD